MSTYIRSFIIRQYNRYPYVGDVAYYWKLLCHSNSSDTAVKGLNRFYYNNIQFYLNNLQYICLHINELVCILQI